MRDFYQGSYAIVWLCPPCDFILLSMADSSDASNVTLHNSPNMNILALRYPLAQALCV